METNTIGKFIAILRKANGMTQKDLGELLNVSDKTVSRWERDETMPDISLFPILAQIFDVTVDELLCGERKTIEAAHENTKKKTERVAWVLNKNLFKYQSLSMISVSLALVGMIIAVIFNFSFKKATLGFYCFLIGYIPACLCQLGLYKYYSSGSQIQDVIPEVLFAHKEKMDRLLLMQIYLFIVLFAFCLPLLIFGKVSYSDYLLGIGFTDSSVLDNTMSAMPSVEIGLQSGSWFCYGGLFGLTAAFICLVFDSIFKFVKKKNNRQLKYTMLTFVIVCLTIWISICVHKVLPAYLVEGTKFHDYASFADYMETIPEDMAWGIVELRKDNSFWKRQVYDLDGNVLLEYTLYNDEVVKIKYADNNQRLPIITYTKEQLNAGEVKADKLIWVPLLIVFMECLGSMLIYKKKK